MEKPKTLEQLRAEKERAETRLAQEQHMPMCEERQTHSDRILPGLTSPIRSAMRATATSSLSLKRQ